MNFFHNNMSCTSMSIDEILQAWTRMALNNAYSWWQDILPEDIVVDIGSGAGWFACQALDRGADKVYIIEPNPAALYDIEKNTEGAGDRVVIVPYAIGSNTCFENQMTWMDFVKDYGIDRVDYLKAHTGNDDTTKEIFLHQDVEWFRWNVRHLTFIAYLKLENIEQFIRWRHTFLGRFSMDNIDKIHLYDGSQGGYLWDDRRLRSGKWNNSNQGDVVTIYITNW